jgi:DNA end-binding protein Ku
MSLLAPVAGHPPVCRPGDIGPIYFNKAYLGPGNDSAKMSCALLRDAMGRSGKAAIARFVMRSKEYLAEVLADGDALVLETPFYADEIRDPHQETGDLPGRVDLSPCELQMASRLIDAMIGQRHPSDYRDTYTDRSTTSSKPRGTTKSSGPRAKRRPKRM